MDESRLHEELARVGIGVSTAAVGALAVHISHIRRWNARLNLVSDSRCVEIVRRHVVDSLLGLRALHAALGPERMRVVDVGSGGGFPGLVAAAVRPAWEVTLLDSSARKTGFLLSASEAMGLGNVRVIRGRAEDIGRGVFAGELPFDVSLSRAVAPVQRLAGLCAPLLRPGGACGWWKGPGASRELREGADSLKSEGLRVTGRYLYRLPGEDISRAIVVLRRLGAGGT